MTQGSRWSTNGECIMILHLTLLFIYNKQLRFLLFTYLCFRLDSLLCGERIIGMGSALYSCDVLHGIRKFLFNKAIAPFAWREREREGERERETNRQGDRERKRRSQSWTFKLDAARTLINSRSSAFNHAREVCLTPNFYSVYC